MNCFLSSFRRFLPALLILFAGATILRAEIPEKNLVLRVGPEYVSPNGDGLQEYVFFYPVLKAVVEPSRYRLDIKQDSTLVMRLTGAGLPALIKWNGQDKKGEPSPNGHYMASITVYGSHFKSTAETFFTIDTVPPVVQLAVSSPVFDESMVGHENIVFTPTIKDDSPIERWQIQVIDAMGQSMRVFWSSGPVQPVEWDGTDRDGVLVPEGVYHCVLQAWDAASNESAPDFQDVQVRVTPREMLKRTLHRINVDETDQGLIVQLRSDELFEVAERRLQLSPEGEELLHEAAILINAYPAAPAHLEGYSHVFKNFLKDQDRASLYAWDAYSYLVKKGNVKASRLSVRGRGRSAMFDRRTVNPPPLRNGVEIILQGEGPW